METDGLRVFVSYSRADEKFVGELVSGLELVGIDVTIDTRDIAEGEDWHARLAAMIESADTVVFVLSKSSVSSEMCNWEVETSVSKGKRLVPILKEQLDGKIPHSKLAEIHYVRFDANDDGTLRSFIGALRALAETLKLDVNWLREHTRLQIRAREWDESGRSEHRLMRAQDIAHAKAWMEQRPAGAPPPTEIQIAFINSSDEAEELRTSAERERLAAMQQAQADREVALKDKEETVRKLSRRTTLGLGATGGLTVASAGLAYWGTSAEHRFNAARREAAVAAEITRQKIIDKDALRTDLKGVLRVSAAAPGQVVYDTGRGSDFSRILSEYAVQDGIAFEDAISLTREEIAQNTNGEQTVYVETYLNSRVYLARMPKQQTRKAIIWVGSEYDSQSFSNLPGTLRDGERWKSTLERSGFDVRITTNPSYNDIIADLDFMQISLSETEVSAPESDILSERPEDIRRTKGIVLERQAVSQDSGLELIPSQRASVPYNALSVVIFSGHAFQMSDGVQRLVVRETQANSLSSLMTSSVSVSRLMGVLDSIPGASLLVMDACRNSIGHIEAR